MICIMLNPPQSVVLTELLTEALTPYEYVLHVRRSAILNLVPFYCKFRYVIWERPRSTVLFWGNGMVCGIFKCVYLQGNISSVGQPHIQ